MNRALADKWLAKARAHEEAMRTADGEECFLHREIAETLRQCASDLQGVKTPTSNINECPSCKRKFKDGETCSRGGCPMGGDF